ncbi:hypothetical protein SAMN05216330_11914 [Bradyrhizobium sp. Ghvi]|nr:hypothetical protein SAMN05216330_11914 [Bradyrhizobium sp. Ghvi]
MLVLMSLIWRRLAYTMLIGMRSKLVLSETRDGCGSEATMPKQVVNNRRASVRR